MGFPTADFFKIKCHIVPMGWDYGMPTQDPQARSSSKHSPNCYSGNKPSVLLVNDDSNIATTQAVGKVEQVSPTGGTHHIKVLEL